MLHHPDNWVWDSWVADDGERYHLFYLQAPRSLGDPRKRHRAATIGHACSDDLVDWQLLPDALHPEPGAWDDLALWTGSVVRDDEGLWRMYYTGLGTRGWDIHDQRIGMAVSHDLVTWHRTGTEPLLSVDPRWYKAIDETHLASETWRDPTVFRDPDGDGWHMLVTAARVGAAPNDDGVLAHAHSHDLEHWEVGPPLCDPGAGFGHLEVPQVRSVDGQAVLVFTCHPEVQTPERVSRCGPHSTWAVTGRHPLGPWDIGQAQPLIAEPTLFAAPLVQRRDGSWVLLGFRNQEPEGIWSFEILDPIPVSLQVGGGLVAG